jgi:hypothetical protein
MFRIRKDEITEANNAIIAILRPMVENILARNCDIPATTVILENRALPRTFSPHLGTYPEL